MSEDEFGFDDDVFDAADLAKLDEIEQKYIATVTQVAPPKPASVLPAKPSQDRLIRPLPSKRIRSNDWRPASRPNRTIQDDDNEPPPIAIVATKDGKYRAINPAEASTRTLSLAIPSTLPPRTLSGAPARPDSVVPLRRAEQTPTPAYSQGQRDSAGDGAGSSNARFAAITAALQETNLNSNVEDELLKLRAEVAKLRELQEATEASLKAAKEEKWTKDGEISTMRRNMAKITASHTETLTKLQAEKQLAEEKRKQHERQMNQEMERLRSSLALRRQELETSVRKTPWSIRKHPSMMPTPARMRDPHRLSVNETPSRPSFTQSSQTRLRKDDNLENATSKINKGKGQANQAPAFNSLVDSFNDHSPVKTRIQPKSHGDPKGKDRIQNMEEMFPPIERPEERPPTQVASKTLLSQQRTYPPVRELPVADWGDNAPDLMLEFDQEQETQDIDAVLEDMVLQREEEEPLEVMDMSDQCTRLLFSHTSLPSYQFTLQILLSTPIPNEPSDTLGRYVQACSSLIEALGSRSSDYSTLIQQILKPLQVVAQVLCLISSSVPLAGLLNLFATICLFLPGTTSMLLPSMEDESPPLLSVLSAVFRTQCTPSSPYTDEKTLLIRESLNLFEVLCLSVPKDSSQQMKFLLHEHGVMANLLDDRQPLWILQNTVRALSILCAEHDSFGFLLAFPNPSPGGKEQRRDSTRIPLLERLSYMLVERSMTARSKEHISVQMSIITCLTQLAIASPDALAILLASQSLIPALVMHLNDCTIGIWDGDEEGLDDGTLLSVLQIMQGSLQLLHYLIFREDLENDLQRKLQQPPPRFKGIEHMFVIGLGRLSYADPPEWENKAAKELAESSAELARDLLEHVVDGPEVDTIWASYQGGESSHDDSLTEDDEMDALKSGPSIEDMIIVD